MSSQQDYQRETNDNISDKQSNKKPKTLITRDKYVRFFMIVGFVDIVMLFADIGLLGISIAIMVLFID